MAIIVWTLSGGGILQGIYKSVMMRWMIQKASNKWVLCTISLDFVLKYSIILRSNSFINVSRERQRWTFNPVYSALGPPKVITF